VPVLAKDVLPILQKLVNDPIPNIRFNVAKSYAVIVEIFRNGHAELIREVMPNLEKLMSDDDVDVRFFASVAAKADGDAMES
jgi:serine/threonine-protein phosphatase 2A regulatory subunit A